MFVTRTEITHRTNQLLNIYSIIENTSKYEIRNERLTKMGYFVHNHWFLACCVNAQSTYLLTNMDYMFTYS